MKELLRSGAALLAALALVGLQGIAANAGTAVAGVFSDPALAAVITFGVIRGVNFLMGLLKKSDTPSLTP